MLIGILIVGILFFGLILKLAEGALKIFLIVVLLILIILGSVFSSHNEPAGPSASLEISHQSEQA